MQALSRRSAILSGAGLAAVSTAPTWAAGQRWPAVPGDMNLGDPQAPVRIVEYLSLTCPHCAHFHADVFPALKAKYIDTGRVYFTVRELLTAPANVAAAGFLMARCNGGKQYFAVVDQVFRSQSRWQGGSIKPIFAEIARKNGMTEAQFEACLVDPKAGEALEARLRYAVDTEKVTGTPTFFINGKPLPNAEVPTLAELDAAIVAALKPGARPAGRR